VLGALCVVPSVVADDLVGSISGRVADSGGNALPGARVEIDPRGVRLVTDREGAFTATGLPAGEYTIDVSYVSFGDDRQTVKVEAGHRVEVQLTLTPHVAEEVTVTAARPRGEVSALNQQKNAQNIVDVLPA